MIIKGDYMGRIFYPTLTRIMDSFSCSSLFLFLYFKLSFQKTLNPEDPEYHTMTLLDVLGKIVWV